MSNKDKYPEAWEIFAECARNIEGCEDDMFGKYCIPHPTNGDIIYSDDPAVLFVKFREAFYKPSFNSPSLYGKIQYIADNF